MTDSATTSMVLTEDGENVLNVEVRAAYQYTTTVTAICGESSDVIYTTEIEENKTEEFYYPKYTKVNDAWYTIEAASGTYYGFTLAPTADDTNYDVTYSVYADSDKVVYYAEVEDVTTGTVGAYPGRYSNGGAIKGATVTTDTLGAGVYTVYVGARNGSGSATANATVSDGTQTLTLADWGTGAVAANSTEITLTSASALTIAGSSTSLEMDYILILKTGDVEVTPDKTYPTVEVTEFGTYTSDADSTPAKAYKGTFTVDETDNYPVNKVTWTVGTLSQDVELGTTIASGDVVVGLVVLAADLDAIPAPEAAAGYAE